MRVVKENRKEWNSYLRSMVVKGEKEREEKELQECGKVFFYFIVFKVLNLLRGLYKDMEEKIKKY